MDTVDNLLVREASHFLATALASQFLHRVLTNRFNSWPTLCFCSAEALVQSPNYNKSSFLAHKPESPVLVFLFPIFSIPIVLVGTTLVMHLCVSFRTPLTTHWSPPNLFLGRPTCNRWCWWLRAPLILALSIPDTRSHFGSSAKIGANCRTVGFVDVLQLPQTSRVFFHPDGWRCQKGPARSAGYVAAPPALIPTPRPSPAEEEEKARRGRGRAFHAHPMGLLFPSACLMRLWFIIPFLALTPFQMPLVAEPSARSSVPQSLPNGSPPHGPPIDLVDSMQKMFYDITKQVLDSVKDANELMITTYNITMVQPHSGAHGARLKEQESSVKSFQA